MTMREKIQSLIANHPTNVIKIEDDGTVRLALNPTALTDSILDALLTGLTQKEADDIQDSGPYFGEINGHDLFKVFIRAIKEGK